MGYRANDVVQRVKALSTKTKDLSMIPRTHMMEGESDFLTLFSDLHTHALAHMYTQRHTHTHRYRHKAYRHTRTK